MSLRESPAEKTKFGVCRRESRWWRTAATYGAAAVGAEEKLCVCGARLAVCASQNAVHACVGCGGACVRAAIVGDRVAIKIGVCAPDCVYARAAFAWVIVRAISGAEIVWAIGAVIVRAIGRQQSVE